VSAKKLPEAVEACLQVHWKGSWDALEGQNGNSSSELIRRRPIMKNHPISRRDFCKAPLALACVFAVPASGKLLDYHRSADAASEGGAREGAREQTIYTGVDLEFVQPWDHLERIKQTKELGLGNFVFLVNTFHVGNTEGERQRWKELYPELAGQIDKVPQTGTLKEVGTPVIPDPGSSLNQGGPAVP
jgi:hypothetical protein